MRSCHAKMAVRPASRRYCTTKKNLRMSPPGARPSMVLHAWPCCGILVYVSKTVCDEGKDVTMAPPPGRLGGTVKMPVQVRMFPEEIAAVDAFAAELSQQSYGAAFSRAEAL